MPKLLSTYLLPAKAIQLARVRERVRVQDTASIRCAVVAIVIYNLNAITTLTRDV